MCGSGACAAQSERGASREPEGVEGIGGLPAGQDAGEAVRELLDVPRPCGLHAGGWGDPAGRCVRPVGAEAMRTDLRRAVIFGLAGLAVLLLFVLIVVSCALYSVGHITYTH